MATLVYVCDISKLSDKEKILIDEMILNNDLGVRNFFKKSNN